MIKLSDNQIKKIAQFMDDLQPEEPKDEKAELISQAISALEEQDIHVSVEDVLDCVDIVNNQPNGELQLAKYLKSTWLMNSNDIQVVLSVIEPLAHALL